MQESKHKPEKAVAPHTTSLSSLELRGYERFAEGIKRLLTQARQKAVRSVNTVVSTTYWEIGRRTVEFEQRGQSRAGYGEALLKCLSEDLAQHLGRGFSVDNLELMRRFYLAWPPRKISEMLSRKSGQTGDHEKSETVSRKFSPEGLATALPLSWSQYVCLLRINNDHARAFYEAEAIRNDWSVRQLERQINSQFYERTALSRDKAAMLTKGTKPRREDLITPEEEIKDPYILEFLNLKDEYSESDLEEALIRHLEWFLLELGGDFTFVARQKRLKVGSEWYRVDLVFFHRRLRSLVLVDLKIGKFTHADAGQMHLYLNYAQKHWTHPDENPPVGLILCAQKDEAVVRYALENLPNKVLAAEYKTILPDEHKLAEELKRTRIALNSRMAADKLDNQK